MCKYEEDGDFGYTYCTLDGITCDPSNDCPAFEPSEWDVMNGYYDNDPEGLEMYQKRQKGVSCEACKFNCTDGFRCVYCYAYDLFEKKD